MRGFAPFLVFHPQENSEVMLLLLEEMLPGLHPGLGTCEPYDATMRPGCFLSLVCQESPARRSQQPAHTQTLLEVRF